MEQCWNGLCFWSRSIEWIWVECAQYAYQWDGLLHVGWKEEHFVLEILIHSVIMCILYYCYIWLWYRKLYKREWKWMGMWLVVISKSASISIIHNWKWMSNAQIWFRNGCGLWLGLECYIWLHYWCWQGHSV